MVLNNSLFELWSRSDKASQFATDLAGRAIGCQYGVVTNNQDPLNMRRVKVALESKGGLIETDWAMSMRLIPGWDPPIPQVGTTVIVIAGDGDPHDLVYLGPVINQTNPQDSEQGDPVNDDTRSIPGNSVHKIGGTRDLQVTGKYTISSDETHHTSQFYHEDLVRMPLVDSLPAATPDNQGKMCILKGNATVCVSDKLYVCLMTATGTPPCSPSYQWKLMQVM